MIDMKKSINLENNYPFKENDIIVLACSAGADSMSLMDMLLKLRERKNVFLICAHVNHNVREESKMEQQFMKEYCQENNIAFETMTIEKYSDDNFHNEARAIRYQFFKDVVEKYNANYLLTAHHADDLMETILMRIVRGSTLEGYAGFKQEIDYKNYKLVRPLLNFTKQELLDYDIQNNVPYYEDASNHKMKYTRNRYRKEVLPFLKKEDPIVHEKFRKFSNIVQEASDFIEEELKPYIDKALVDNTLNLDVFNKFNKFVKRNIINHMLKDFYQDDLMLLQDRHTELVLQLASSKKASTKIYLPNEVIAIKTYQTLILRREVKEVTSYEIELTNYAYLPNKHHIEIIKEYDKNGNDVIRLNSEEIVLPLTVRTRKSGDKMTLKGVTGHRKIKDIFIDAKVPKEARDLWPVICDAKGEIVFLPGLKKSKFDKPKNAKYDIIVKYY